MKLLRYGPVGAEKPGVLDGQGIIRDLSAHIDDVNPSNLGPDSLASLRRLSLDELPVVSNDQRIGPCVADSPNFHCIGLNYADHAAESGMEPPSEPILFSKATSCISGPNDGIVIPSGSKKTDWEVELCVVIGSRASYVSEAQAPSHVAGYCVANDVSERAYQLENTGQWVKGKSAETFGPIGPWMVTADEVANPQNMNLWLEVDGVQRQYGNTDTMIFGVAFLISYMSRFMTLLPGDLIATGTPPGVGQGFKPPVFLQAGNEVRLGVEGLGEQHQHVSSRD